MRNSYLSRLEKEGLQVLEQTGWGQKLAVLLDRWTCSSPPMLDNASFLVPPVKTLASRLFWKPLKVLLRKFPLKLELLKQDSNIPSFKSSVSGYFSL